mmetsp:Transcript_9553/g.24441  ORF Transcript_9553/g.24441 Transcript_9553/m.24441 type:complete len:547 (-) Transcript_9553:1127-2767(-)
MTTTTTQSAKALGNLEAVKLDDMVSARSLGSLASVGEVFHAGRQKLTTFAVFACITGAFAGLLFGFDQNVFNMIVAQDDFREFMGFPFAQEGCGRDAPQDPAWVSSKISGILGFYSLGAAFLAPFAGSISDRFGRYKTLWVGMLAFFLGASLQTGATGYSMLVAGRLIAGASIGILSGTVPVFISELAPHHLRGGLGTFFQCGIVTGALLASLWNMLIQGTVHTANAWRIQAGLQIVLGGFMAIGLAFVPETPRWLAKSGQTDKARSTLAKLRGEACAEVTEAEMKEIEAEVEAEKACTASIFDLFSKQVIFATMVGLGIQLLQQLTGMNVFMSYSTTIFNNLCLNGNAFTIAQSLVNFFATFGAIYLSDKFGRKKMLMGASSVMFAVLIISAGLGWGIDMERNVVAAYAIAVLICIFTVAFASAWGPNGWIIPSEVFPLRLRGKGAGCATFVNWFFCFIVMYTTPLVVNSSMGAEGLYVIYGIIMALAIPALLFLMPETSGVPLEEMEAKFNKPFGDYVKDNAQDLRRRKPAEAKPLETDNASKV